MSRSVPDFSPIQKISMNRLILLLLGISALGAGILYAAVRSAGPPRIEPGSSTDDSKHHVTPSMLAATDTMTHQAAPGFGLKGTDGASYDLEALAKDGPLVLFFIKDGCPCSSDAQRYFNRLHAAYGKDVRFLGVIDGDNDRGRAWGQKNGTTFPLVADPDLAVIHAYKAESSAYVALIAKGGEIDHIYPGYSASMLAESGARIARLAGVAPRAIDASGAPDELLTGCSYAP
jgi:peroxiredoxin